MQCARCNMDDGEQYNHGLEIDKKYGEGTAEKLTQLSNKTIKLDNNDLQELLEKLQQKFCEFE